MAFFFSFCLYYTAFCPYHIGHFSIVGLGFEEYVSTVLYFQNVKTTTVYVITVFL